MRVVLVTENLFEVGELNGGVVILKGLPLAPGARGVRLTVADALNLAAHLIATAKAIGGAERVTPADVYRAIGVQV